MERAKNSTNVFFMTILLTVTGVFLKKILFLFPERVSAGLLKHPLKPLFILFGHIYIFMLGDTENSSESLFSVHKSIYNEAFIRVKAFNFFLYPSLRH